MGCSMSWDIGDLLTPYFSGDVDLPLQISRYRRARMR
jgi:hypothetical protein